MLACGYECAIDLHRTGLPIQFQFDQKATEGFALKRSFLAIDGQMHPHMVVPVACFGLSEQEDQGDEDEDRKQYRDAVFEDVSEEGGHLDP